MNRFPHHQNGNGHNGRSGHNGRHGFTINWAIRGDTVRLVEDGGAKLCPKKGAIETAQAQGMDLVEVAHPENGVAVCKIADLGRLRYEREKNHKKAKPSKTKEIGLHANIGEHDLQTKMRHAREFLAEHNQIVFRLQLRGRERAHKDLALGLLGKISTALSDCGRFDPPNSTGAITFLRGHPKKGAGQNNGNGHGNGNGQNGAKAPTVA